MIASRHSLVLASSFAGWQHFKDALAHPEATQRQVLRRLLQRAESTWFGQRHRLHSGVSYEGLLERLPVSDYASWAELIERQRGGEVDLLCAGCDRYQPTSGSTDAIKWIPHPPAYREELDAALSPWLWDMVRQFPRVLQGPHYWSLSWLPDDLRGQLGETDDLQVLPHWKRRLMAQTMAAHPGIGQAGSLQAARLGTLAYLVSRPDLSLLSVWSPTFALGLLELLSQQRLALAELLEQGRWGVLGSTLEQELASVPCPRHQEVSAILRSWDGVQSAEFYGVLWPKLAVVSAWDTAASRHWALRLQQLLPQAAFQGKGLWATEGVISIPYQKAHTLAVRSHFYEFKCLETGRILPAWSLEPAQQVQPLLSTSSGLWRYLLPDRLEVTGWTARTPNLRFLGRIGGVDMVGEKLSSALALSLIERLKLETGVQVLCLVATRTETHGAGYVALAEASCDEASPASNLARVASAQAAGALVTAGRRDVDIARQLEVMLLESFHYRLARSLGQLAPVKVWMHPRPLELYEHMGLQRGMILGNLKVEPLVRWDEAGTYLELLDAREHTQEHIADVGRVAHV